ncbi:MAG TPA: site-2 protease family protein [Candidatus Binatia bacterium]|nr:site-2 protease family protein [Candidatus Binatia bacterium]
MPNPLELVQQLAVWALPVLLAFTGHAIVMAQLAWRLGDRSPAIRERLSLNPLRHIDPVGTVLVPGILIVMGGFVIGWPRPVPVNPAAFRQPRKDLALLSLGAVASNLAMAIAWAFVLRAAIGQDAEEGIWLGVKYMGLAGVTINVVFAIFGLLPIPGFAGGHALAALLPPHLAHKWYRAEQWTFLVLILLMVTGVLGALLQPPFLALQSVVFQIAGVSD